MIMTYLAVLLYPFVYKVKTALIEIIYGRGKFVVDFNMGNTICVQILPRAYPFPINYFLILFYSILIIHMY